MHEPGKATGVILMVSPDELRAMVRSEVANGIQEAMDKLDRARAAQVMSSKQMAAHLGKTERTLANWVKKGMPHFFVGNERRFRRGEAEAWAAEPRHLHRVPRNGPKNA